LSHHLREHEVAQVYPTSRARLARSMARYRDDGEVQIGDPLHLFHRWVVRYSGEHKVKWFDAEKPDFEGDFLDARSDEGNDVS
jgi:hypothetical protein